MSGPLSKHDLSGIGGFQASIAFAALAANPSTAGITTGLLGKIVFYFISKLFTALSSLGLVLLNVGASKIETALDKANYDGSFDSAEKAINEIRGTGRELNPEEVAAIDDKVIIAFEKFAKLGKKKKK